MSEGMGNPEQSWTYGYLHGEKNPLQVSLPSWYFYIPFQINPGQKMIEILKDINLGGCIYIAIYR